MPSDILVELHNWIGGAVSTVVRALETEPSDDLALLHTKLQEAKSIIQRINA